MDVLTRKVRALSDKVTKFILSLGPLEAVLFVTGLATLLFLSVYLLAQQTKYPTFVTLIAFAVCSSFVLSIAIAAWQHRDHWPPSLYPEGTTAGTVEQTFRETLRARLQVEIMEHGYVLPTETQWQLIFSTAEAILAVKQTPPHLLSQPRPPEVSPLQIEWDKKTAEWAKARDYIFEAIVAAMAGYIKHLKPIEPGPFQKPLEASPSMIYDVVAPFRAPQLKELGLCQWITDQYNRNVYSLSKPGAPPMQPQNYTGPRGAMADIYLRGTPLLPLTQVLEPFQPFTDEMRFTHHWCLGDTGTGKTTFLRHIIQDDLNRVARDECSLVVIDSKTLVGEMKKLKAFASGHPLDGRLILIDAETVFPLNPFRLPKAQGLPMLVYMLAGLTEASKLQMGVLRHYVNAAYSMNNPTLYTLTELMQTPKDKLPAGLNPERLDDITRKWFLHTRKGVAGLTSGGIEQRLMDFLDEFQDGPFLKMLNADNFALDMSEVDRGGRVLLVDTSRSAFGKQAGALLGRLIIALIDQLASKRTDHPGPPIFVVIDEAQDYIAQDEIFADILEKARSSKIGVTVAHHHLKQSGGFIPGVVAALEQSGIKSRCVDIGKPVHIHTRRADFDLPVRKLEFDDPMSPQDYVRLREHLAFLYPYKASPPKSEEQQPLTQKF